MKFDLYTQKGEKKGQVEGSDALFGIEMNEDLVTRALLRQQGNARQGTAHTKTRGEKQCSTRKIYRQKGTGNARHGAKSANLFRGGGVTFGPRYGRNWKTDMPKKQRRKALFCALSVKARDGKIFALEGYEGAVKTKDFVSLLGKLPVEKSTLVVMDKKNEVLEKSSNNVPRVKSILVNYLNIADALKYDSLIFLSGALVKAEEVFLSDSFVSSPLTTKE
jgi:large subunit ribosomal protein L4